MAQDFSKLSDEELDALIEGRTNAPPGEGLQAAGAARAAVIEKAERKDPMAIAEQIEPSALKRGLAGMGGAMLEPVMGAVEKLRLAFPGEGAAGAETIKQIGEDRSARRGAQRQLTETPAGQFGAFMGEVTPYAIAAPTIPAQMATAGVLGALRGGPDRPPGFGAEMASSGVSGLTEAGTTGGVLKGMQMAGKGINAARGAYSPEGQRMMDVDAAAGRLGLTGDSAPSIRQLALNVPENAEQVGRQADVLRRTLATERQVPSATGAGMETQKIPGGVMREELAGAVNERLAQGRAKYAAVDEYALANKLDPVTPIYSLPQLMSMQKGAVKGDEAPLLAINMLAHSNPVALEWVGKALAQGATPAQIKAGGIPMSTYHEMRVAAGKAISNLDRMNPATKTAPQWRAQKLLTDLRNGLDNEAENWAKKNSGNREAMDLYNNAKSFYRDVVAPTVMENPLARKATSRRTPFVTAEDMYSAVVNPRNEELLGRLEPTMGAAGRDIISTLRGLPDVGQAMATRRAPNAPVRGGLELANVVAALRGHPLAAAASFAPGLGPLSRSQAMKRMYAAENPLQEGVTGRAIAAGSQYPQDHLEGGLDRFLSRPQR